MQIVSVNENRYLVLGTVSVNKVTNTNTFKSKYFLADTVLRNGDLYYACRALNDYALVVWKRAYLECN